MGERGRWGRGNKQEKSPEDWPVVFSGLPFLRLSKSGEYLSYLARGGKSSW